LRFSASPSSISRYTGGDLKNTCFSTVVTGAQSAVVGAGAPGDTAATVEFCQSGVADMQFDEGCGASAVEHVAAAECAIGLFNIKHLRASPANFAARTALK